MMITAPNSLNPRAHIRINPDRTDRQARGRETVKKTLTGDAPNVKATFSNLSGTAANPSREALIKNGTLTNAIAKIIPAGLPMNFIPKYSAPCPNILSRDKIPKTAIPAAECGIIIGISIIPLTKLLSGKFLRASKYAKGIAKNENRIVPAIEVHKLSHTLSRTSLSPRVLAIDPNDVFKYIPAIGATIKSRTTPPRNVNIKLIHEISLNELVIFSLQTPLVLSVIYRNYRKLMEQQPAVPFLALLAVPFFYPLNTEQTFLPILD